MNQSVLWSGGVDSTLALYRAARDGWVKHRDGAKVFYGVRAISIDCRILAANDEQRRARAAIRKRFDELGLDIEYATVTYDCDVGLSNPADGNGQLGLWTMLALTAVRAGDKAVFGWLQGEMDDLEHLEKISRELFEITNRECGLSFPLRHMTKADVIAEMRKLELYDLCFWCQDPVNGQSCGGQRCHPCRRDLAARWEIEQPWYTGEL